MLLLTFVLHFVFYVKFTSSLPPARPVSFLLPPPPTNYYREVDNTQNTRFMNEIRGVRQENVHFQNLQELRGQNYNLPQNFQTNFRDHLEPKFIDKLQPPKPVIVKPFNAAKPLIATTLQRDIPPVHQETRSINQIQIRNIHNPLPNNIRPTFATPGFINTIVSPLPPLNRVQNVGQTTVTKKRFTIIHPNGTIEQSDSLGDVSKIYPNYVLLKSSDMNRNSFPINAYNSEPVKPEQVYAKNPLPYPALVPIFNKPAPKVLRENTRETLFPNTLKEHESYYRSPQIVTNNLLSSTMNSDANNISLRPKNFTNSVLNNKTVDSHLSAVKSNSRVDEETKHTENKIQNILTDSSVPKLYSQNTSSTAVSNKKISETSVNEINEFKIENSDQELLKIKAHVDDNKEDTTNINVPKIEPPLNNTYNNETRLQNNLYEDENDVKTKQQGNEIKDILMDSFVPKLDSQYNISAAFTNKTDSETNVIKLDESKTEKIEYESLEIEPDVDSTEDTTDINVLATELPLNDTYDDETILENNLYEDDSDYTDNNTSTCLDEENSTEKIYVPNVSILQENDTDSPFWFKASNENIWDKLLKKNKTTNIYFLVPKVSLEKDTTITIYPNGTTIEEIKIIKDDGTKPVVTRTITHADDKEINTS